MGLGVELMNLLDGLFPIPSLHNPTLGPCTDLKIPAWSIDYCAQSSLQNVKPGPASAGPYTVSNYILVAGERT